MNKVHIREEFETMDAYWRQRVVGEANGQLIKLAKGIGALEWHKHDDQDELFLVLGGELTIELRDRVIDLRKDELFVVPKGIEHRPRTAGEVQLLVMGLNITSNAEGGRPDDWNPGVPSNLPS